MTDPFNISRTSLKGHRRYLFWTWIFPHWHFWYNSRLSQVSYMKFRFDPMYFPDRNKRSSYQMYNFFSCYVLILIIYMKPQTQVSIFKYFTSKKNISLWGLLGRPLSALFKEQNFVCLCLNADDGVLVDSWFWSNNPSAAVTFPLLSFANLFLNIFFLLFILFSVTIFEVFPCNLLKTWFLSVLLFQYVLQYFAF